MNEITNSSSSLSVYPTKQEIPETTFNNVSEFLRSDFRFPKDFHLLQFMSTSADSSTHFTSASLKKYPRILMPFYL